MKFTRATYREAYRKMGLRSDVLMMAMSLVDQSHPAWLRLSDKFVKAANTQIAIRSRGRREKRMWL